MALDSATSAVNKKKENSTLVMSTRTQPTTRSPLNCEVSLSFQDELAATIHGAFEVAVEIAVLEITKLVGQALGDVRDQMHETLRENKSLKIRLQTAEQQLDALRCNLDDGSQVRSVAFGQVGSDDGIRQPHVTSKAKAAKSNSLSEETTRAKAPNLVGDSINELLLEPCGFTAADTESSSRSNASFSEIREDGRVCSHHLHQELGRDTVPSQDTSDPSATKGSCSSAEPLNHAMTVKLDGQSTEDTAGLNTSSSSSLYGGMELCKIEQVKVKEEKSEPDHPPTFGSGPSAVVEDEFDPDSLSLAQSKLLEDWRPEPLELNQGCQASRFGPCTSRSLADPPVSNPEPTAPGGFFPSPFPNPTSVPVSQEPYGVQASGTLRPHVCRVCGDAFHLPGELRRHHSQQHGKAPPRNPRRQAFPPGRSPYRCSQCGRDFNRMENLKTHLRIHTGERPYSCSVCGMRFRHSGALTRHFRIHTGEKPYACSQCGKTFRNCGGLRFHQRAHTREGHGTVN